MAKTANNNWRHWIETLEEFEQWANESGLPVGQELALIKTTVHDFGSQHEAEEQRIAALDALEAEREQELIKEERRHSAPREAAPLPGSGKSKLKTKKKNKVSKAQRNAGRFTGKVKGVVHCDRCKAKHLDGWRFKRDLGDTQVVCRYCRVPILETLNALQQGSQTVKEANDAMRRRVSGSYGSSQR